MTAAPLTALLLSDGRPGHFNLAEGILAAIARLRAVTIERVEVRRPAWMPARGLSAMVNAGVPPRTILQTIYGVAPSSLPEADIVVSAGGNTLAANIAAARLLGVPNIFYGSLRRYRPSDFSLVLTSYRSQVAEPHPVMTLKPSKLDPDTLGARDGTIRRLGLIIGGDGGTVRYVPADWDQLFGFIKSYAQEKGARWVVANSPRTPDAVSDRLTGLANSSPECVGEFIDFRVSGLGSLTRMLADTGAVLCTADSSTMLSESVWARRPVLAVSPASWALPDNERDYRNWLGEQGYAREAAITSLTPELVDGIFAEISPLAINPLDDLAALLARHLPELFPTS